MTEKEEMTVYNLAEEFVENTPCSVFLTGKAGTGKTTFLRKIKEQTKKQMVVVAPTGVAAINAGGVTIHSFFQIPPTPYVPSYGSNSNFFAKQQVNSIRRKLFRQLELLVIDEISMVRADLLDLIDIILRHYRYRNSEPFGGVQVIFIGDMYQLAPVCTSEDWDVLRHYYQSPYFFHSKVLEGNQPIYVELDKIFRQTNRSFINILNEVRNNRLSEQSMSLLMRRYNPSFRPKDEDGYITLTTHNAHADRINSEALAKIDAPEFYYESEVKGDFPEKAYPAESLLKLKLGAKVMFIANDKENPRRYYNGRLGIISSISDEEIWVTCDGEAEAVLVEKEQWTNTQYKLDKESNTIEENVLGTFSQMPLRLAWAITIHKSQGLTFDKVIIDAGAAFASGQVYVALSRCRTLDGIVLTTQINPDSLEVNNHIVSYSSGKLSIDELERTAEMMKNQYSLQILSQLFALDDVMTNTRDFVNAFLKVVSDFNEQTKEYLESIQVHASELYAVAQKFIVQLNQLSRQNSPNLKERVAAAATYYEEKLNTLVSMIEASPVVTDSKTEAEDYVDRLRALYDIVTQRVWIISGIKDDFSVSNYFNVKSSFRPKTLNVKAYSGDKVKQLVKSDHPKLYVRLAACRNELCEKYSMPVYMVATTKMLTEIANTLPLTTDSLERIKGFGKAKVKRFGKEFIDAVEAYCDENGITPKERSMKFEEEMDVHENEEPTKKRKSKTQATQKINTLDESLLLFKQGLSVEEVAKKRNLSQNTISAHLIKLIAKGDLDGRNFVSTEKFALIRGALSEIDATTSLTEVFDLFGGSFSYDELRIVKAQMIADETL